MDYNTLREVLLRTSYNDMKNICSANKQTKDICDNLGFWFEKAKFTLNVNSDEFNEVINGMGRGNPFTTYSYLYFMYKIAPILNNILIQYGIEKDDINYSWRTPTKIGNKFGIVIVNLISLNVLQQISEKLPEINNISFKLKDALDNTKLASEIWKFVPLFNEFLMNNGWPELNKYIEYFYQNGVTFANVTHILITNLLYILTPNEYQMLFKVFPNIVEIQYYGDLTPYESIINNRIALLSIKYINNHTPKNIFMNDLIL